MRYDGKDLEMKIYQKSDPSFKIMNFVGVCGSNEVFVDVPNDFEPFEKAKLAFEKSNKINSQNLENDKQDYLEEIRKNVRKEWERHINNNPKDIPSIPGNASEAAMIKFFEKSDFSVKELRELYPPYRYKCNKVEIPFNSDLKMSFNMRLVNEDGIDFLQVAVKGAPENLVKKCKYYLRDGKEYLIDESFKSDFETANNAFALKGERVIGYAYKRLDPKIYTTEMDFPRSTREEIETLIDKWNLSFVGVVAIEDPPRKGVKEAIKICHEAGVKVIMVTGDQTLTAASLANQIGIIENLDETPEIIMKTEGLASLEEAEKNSKVLFIIN
jgi:sodium/potassium-transporting ATPase subunit alpha